MSSFPRELKYMYTQCPQLFSSTQLQSLSFHTGRRNVQRRTGLSTAGGTLKSSCRVSSVRYRNGRRPFVVSMLSSRQPCMVVLVMSSSSLVPRPFWEGETAWQLLPVQTVTSAARELEVPIKFQLAVT